MEIIAVCEKTIYQGRCIKCGSLLELSVEEYKNVIFTCPCCGKQSILRKGTINRYFIDDHRDRYTRG